MPSCQARGDGVDHTGRGGVKAWVRAEVPKGRAKQKARKVGKRVIRERQTVQDGSKAQGTTTTTSSTASAGAMAFEDKGQGKKEGLMAKKAEAEAPTVAGTGEASELMGEVTNLLRSLRVGNPQVRACKVRRLDVSESRNMLIDGGATHCLRQAHSAQEWDEARAATVYVASGEVQMRQHPTTLTILSEEPVQGIIPVGRLVQQGYAMRWDCSTCMLEHQKHGKIPVMMIQGCPHVSETWGTVLMGEIEEAERKRAKIRSILCDNVLAEDAHEKNVAELSGLFPQVPLRILERLPGEEHVDTSQVPLNRRRRRRLDQASQIVIHMFSGAGEKAWRVLEKVPGVAVLCIDLKMGHNITEGHLAGYISGLIATGKVTVWL